MSRHYTSGSQVEESWALVGFRRRGVWRCRRLRYQSGATASVVADGPWALRREEVRGDVVGFMHTHPMGGLSPSPRDVRTMRAWCDALGKCLLCVIATPDAIGAWRFDDFKSNGRRLARVSMIGKTKLTGVECHGGKVSSRAALSRQRSAEQAGSASRRSVRGRRRRVEPRG